MPQPWELNWSKSEDKPWEKDWGKPSTAGIGRTGPRLKGEPKPSATAQFILPTATAVMAGGPILGESAGLIPGGLQALKRGASTASEYAEAAGTKLGEYGRATAAEFKPKTITRIQERVAAERAAKAGKPTPERTQQLEKALPKPGKRTEEEGDIYRQHGQKRGAEIERASIAKDANMGRWLKKQGMTKGMFDLLSKEQKATLIREINKAYGTDYRWTIGTDARAAQIKAFLPD